jgi:E3 ubiquitin-protein ligase HERC3
LHVGSDLNVTGLFAGSRSTCVILNNANSKCWGNNNLGQLGYGDATTRGNDVNQMGNDLATLNLNGNTPIYFAVSNYINAVYGDRCVLVTTGALTCWGYNEYGQLGAGDTLDRVSAPNTLANVSLGSGRSVTQVALGGMHTCAILDNNALKCWGLNHIGQLGYGDNSHRGDNPDEIRRNTNPNPEETAYSAATQPHTPVGANHADQYPQDRHQYPHQN